MSPKKHYERLVKLMGANSEENPAELVRELPKLSQQGSLDLLVDEQGVFEKPEGDVEDGYSHRSLKLRESALLYSQNGQINTVKLYENREKVDEDAVKQDLIELEKNNAEKISEYHITEYVENGDTHYYLDIKMPFDFNKEDVKFFVYCVTKEFEVKTRVSRIYQDNGSLNFMEEYSEGHEHEDVEALGLKKGDFLHIRTTVPTKDKFQSEEALMFLDLIVDRYTQRFREN